MGTNKRTNTPEKAPPTVVANHPEEARDVLYGLKSLPGSLSWWIDRSFFPLMAMACSTALWYLTSFSVGAWSMGLFCLLFAATWICRHTPAPAMMIALVVGLAIAFAAWGIEKLSTLRHLPTNDVLLAQGQITTHRTDTLRVFASHANLVNAYLVEHGDRVQPGDELISFDISVDLERFHALKREIPLLVVSIRKLVAEYRLEAQTVAYQRKQQALEKGKIESRQRDAEYVIEQHVKPHPLSPQGLSYLDSTRELVQQGLLARRELQKLEVELHKTHTLLAVLEEEKQEAMLAMQAPNQMAVFQQALDLKAKELVKVQGDLVALRRRIGHRYLIHAPQGKDLPHTHQQVAHLPYDDDQPHAAPHGNRDRAHPVLIGSPLTVADNNGEQQVPYGVLHSSCSDWQEGTVIYRRSLKASRQVAAGELLVKIWTGQQQKAVHATFARKDRVKIDRGTEANCLIRDGARDWQKRVLHGVVEHVYVLNDEQFQVEIGALKSLDPAYPLDTLALGTQVICEFKLAETTIGQKVLPIQNSLQDGDLWVSLKTEAKAFFDKITNRDFVTDPQTQRP